MNSMLAVLIFSAAILASQGMSQLPNAVFI